MSQLNFAVAPSGCPGTAALQPGDVFLAFRGEYADGRDYIAAALGAALQRRRAVGFGPMALPASGRPRPIWPCPSCARAPG